MVASFILAPSLLSADFSRLAEELHFIEANGGQWVHLDVMDGAFVPNLTFGAPVVRSLRSKSSLPFDVHLMVARPQDFVKDFAAAGADYFTFHIEAAVHAHRLITEIRAADMKPGVSIVPSTPVHLLDEVLPFVDLVLVMTVNPGFGGQTMIPCCLEKIRKLCEYREKYGYRYLISVDGGVNAETLSAVCDAGADVVVSGSSFFFRRYKEMKKKLVFACLVCLTICRLFADSDDLLAGLDAYSRGNWSAAVQSFERALTVAPNDRTEALYWLVMSETSAQNYKRALDYADRFLERASADERAGEVSYQKGRLLHLSGDYERSSNTLYRFVKDYPVHPKIPSAYYWIGENLYATGKYTEAREIFNDVVANYPRSGKASEARYKIVLIDQQSIREELLQLASEANASAAFAKNEPKSVEFIEENLIAEQADATVASDSDSEAAMVGNDASSVEEQKRNQELADRLTVLEEKLDELSVMLARIAEEQKNQHIWEQQQKGKEEQEEIERQQLEKRRQELTELKDRTRTLEQLYEQRMKGAK